MSLSIIQQPPALLMARQPVVFVLQSDSIGTPLRIAAGVTGQAAADSIQADADKKASFELSDYLQGLITTRHKTGSVAEVYSDVPLPVTFDFVEWAGDPPVDTFDLVDQGPFYLLDALIPKSRSKAFYTSYSSLLNYLITTKSCLTWWPDSESKKVGVDQPEFLNFLQVQSITPISVAARVTFNFTDGTSVDNAVVNTVTGVEYMQLVYFPCGYTQLGIALVMAEAYADKTLASYSVVIKTGTTVISKVYTFEPDATYYDNTRILYVKNPFGLLEIVRCTGKGEQNNKITIEIARTDGQILPDKISWKNENEDVVKANTGHLSKLQMQWLSYMDFLEAYELQGSILHPIVFHDLSLPVIHDNIYQYDAELEYEYAYLQTIETA